MAKSPKTVELLDAPDAELSPVARAKRSSKQLPPHEIQPEGAKWGRWSIMAQADHTIEDAMGPRYLYAKADQIRPGDYVEIKHPLGNWVVCFDVVRIDRQARGIVANVRHIFDYTQEGGIRITPDVLGAHVEYLGARGWAVIDEDKHVLADEFESREVAEGWLTKKRAA
jgi:hypothetical protein